MSGAPALRRAAVVSGVRSADFRIANRRPYVVMPWGGGGMACTVLASSGVHWPGSPSPIGGSGYSGELPLDLAIHGSLKADEQLLIQHGGDPLQGRQLRDVRALLEP
jgi:hypothetical protein